LDWRTASSISDFQFTPLLNNQTNMNHLRKSLLLLSFFTLTTAVAMRQGVLAQNSPGEPVTKPQSISGASSPDAASVKSATKTKTSDSEETENNKQSTQSGHSGEHSSTVLPISRSEELTLGDLRDSGIALNQIRQEAINIFLEATRTLCDKTTRSELIIPNSITEKDLEFAVKINAYQPPRPQWLFYYVGTMEPIISMLSEDVHDAKSGVSKMLVPAGTLEHFKPLWLEWTTGIAGINNELTDISKLVDSTPPDNAALAKHALAMYKLTERLEHTRQKAFILVRDASKHGNVSEKVSLPGDK
jgi:hypothetical protein